MWCIIYHTPFLREAVFCVNRNLCNEVISSIAFLEIAICWCWLVFLCASSELQTLCKPVYDGVYPAAYIRRRGNGSVSAITIANDEKTKQFALIDWANNESCYLKYQTLPIWMNATVVPNLSQLIHNYVYYMVQIYVASTMKRNRSF